MSLLSVDELRRVLSSMEDAKHQHPVICQGFIGGKISGENILHLKDVSVQDLAKLIDSDTGSDREMELEFANEQLNRLSQIDGLTGLYNRATWENMLESELLRSRRTRSPCSLVMLDIDHFKKTNDTYGHQAGDEAIRVLSNTLKHEKRETDVAGRYGGEEFCVTLIDTDAENAKIFAERFRKSIENMTIDWEGQEIKYTVSLGIAELNSETKNHETWLQKSDKALYFSKENGRNRTTIS